MWLTWNTCHSIMKRTMHKNMKQTFCKRDHYQGSVHKHSVSQMLRHPHRLRLLELHKTHPGGHRHRRITVETEKHCNFTHFKWRTTTTRTSITVNVYFPHILKILHQSHTNMWQKAQSLCLKLGGKSGTWSWKICNTIPKLLKTWINILYLIEKSGDSSMN